jgi:hypothetical protein
LACTIWIWPTTAERLQVESEVGPPRGDADAPAALGQRPHDMAPDKAGAAENRHQPSRIVRNVHHVGPHARRRLSPVFLSQTARLCIGLRKSQTRVARSVAENDASVPIAH